MHCMHDSKSSFQHYGTSFFEKETVEYLLVEKAESCITKCSYSPNARRNEKKKFIKALCEG